MSGHVLSDAHRNGRFRAQFGIEPLELLEQRRTFSGGQAIAAHSRRHTGKVHPPPPLAATPGA
jgi:hypothetical protein